MGLPPQPEGYIGAPTKPTAHDINLAQENTRKALALILLGILGIEILAALAAVYVPTLFLNLKPADRPDLSTSMKDILSIVFGPTIALVGAATGFYFGSNSGQSRTSTTEQG